MSEFEFVDGEGLTHHHCGDNSYGHVETNETMLFKHGICSDCGEERITFSGGAQLGSMLYVIPVILTGMWGLPDGHLAGVPLGILAVLPALLVLKSPDYVVFEGNRGGDR